MEERVHFVHARDHHRLALTEVTFTEATPRSGPRPCFVLVHGFSQDRASYLRGDIPRALVDRGARVFLAELRGHGLSDEDVPREWSLATHLDLDLPALIDRARVIAGVERVHFGGHSMGGMLGYALLAKRAPIASLTTFAAPLVLGEGRPLVRFAALIAGPMIGLGPWSSVPIDYFLRTLAPILAERDTHVFARAMQLIARLANPNAADPDTLRILLERAQPEAPRVFVELARMAIRGRTAIDGIDLVAAVHPAPIPIAAVVGSNDIFAPRAAVEPLYAPESRGPRLVLEIPDALHVDLIVGPHGPGVVDTLWNFLAPA
jgi:pimeloyl-ACP methyl ester carboxylesterase